MPILFRERDAVVAVPRIKHGLVSVGWNRTSLVKRGLGVVSLSGGMSIESLEIDSASWFAVFLWGHYHLVAPSHRCSNGYRLNDP